MTVFGRLKESYPPVPGGSGGQVKQVIDADLAAFMLHSVMITTATRGVDSRPAIGRGVGLRLSEDRSTLDLLISRAQWPGMTSGLQVGAAFAVTLSDPTDYRTFQVKARLAQVADADADDVILAEGYVRRMTQALLDLGVTAQQTACWLIPRDLVRLRLIPMAAFRQTPGPGAGAAHASVGTAA
jgi:hypothetical protein